MRRSFSIVLMGLGSLVAAVPTLAQSSPLRLAGVPAAGYEDAPAPEDRAAPFTSLADSMAWVRERDRAHAARGRRVVVSIRDRRFWWMDGPTVLRTGMVAVGKGTRLSHADRSWEFSTPTGIRRVVSKAANPVWVPPEWHYVEVARDSGWAVVPLTRGEGVRLAGGGRVVVRGDRIVHLSADGASEVIPAGEEIIFGDTIFVPPVGTANRRVEGELGAYKLELGDGYMLHGTPHQRSLGRAATHGCIRLSDEDIEYLYRNVPVGTAVYLY